MEKLITVLTATYNRAHLLPDLYHSLCCQSCKDFEWIVIDDGSKDDTEQLIAGYIEENRISIRYHKQENGGKNRAINHGVTMVTTPYTMIVDSDDYLTDDAIEYLSVRLLNAKKDQSLVGISGKRGEGKQKNEEDSFVVATNLERRKFGLEQDACEVFRTDLLRSHPFEVWPGEKFVPEEIVWNQLAMEGYAFRWYDRVTCIVRYQEGGLTKGSWELLKKNPMGYASMYKQRVVLSKDFRNKLSNNEQLIAQSILGGHPLYAFKGNFNFISLVALPLGVAIAIRRKFQYRR